MTGGGSSGCRIDCRNVRDLHLFFCLFQLPYNCLRTDIETLHCNSVLVWSPCIQRAGVRVCRFAVSPQFAHKFSLFTALFLAILRRRRRAVHLALWTDNRANVWIIVTYTAYSHVCYAVRPMFQRLCIRRTYMWHSEFWAKKGYHFWRQLNRRWWWLKWRSSDFLGRTNGADFPKFSRARRRSV